MQPPSPVVLLTGATGYIGSHTWLCLAAAGFSVVGVDNFANSSPRVLERLGRLLGSTPVFERADVCDAAAMSAVVQRHRVHAVIHFAALKAVGESVHKPLAYYQNNLGGLWATCQALGTPGARCFVFSSSATVYGQPKALPIAEDAPLAATNPYGQTKLMAEQMLADQTPAGEVVAADRHARLTGQHRAPAHEMSALLDQLLQLGPIVHIVAVTEQDQAVGLHAVFVVRVPVVRELLERDQQIVVMAGTGAGDRTEHRQEKRIDVRFVLGRVLEQQQS
ncbi:MAG: NAD-dependent epimerase/dehydratase family protein [Aquincola sp.]|nr:NAD-dependent epimerase/dehydratase family protein [Aquincola sp.]